MCFKKNWCFYNDEAPAISENYQENVVLQTNFGKDFESSGGGIRTPDTRIMIPLL